MEYAKIEFVPKVHSEWGASGYHRWSASRGGCPGSVKLIREKAPPELLIDDEVKDDGIEAHGLGEQFLNAREPSQRSVLMARANVNGGDLVMLNAVAKYVNYVNELATLPGAELLVETSFDLGWLADDLFGTTDSMVYAPFSDYFDLETQTLHKGPTLHVIDFKYGFKEVDAEENPQALYYALGGYAHFRSLGKEVNRIVVHIWQPRVIGRKNAAVRWSCDAAYLEKFAQQLKEDKLATEDPEAPLIPSLDNCRLCKARTVCPELIKPAWKAARMQILSQGGNPDKVLPTYEQGKEDAGTLYMVAGLAKKWAESTMERTRAEMQQGKKAEGLKLVAGKNSRVFNDIQQIQEIFPREGWPELYEEPEIKSVSGVLEALHAMENDQDDAVVLKEVLQDYLDPLQPGEKESSALQRFEKKFTRKIPGAPLVALEADKREEWTSIDATRKEWADELAPVPAPPPPPAASYANVPPPPVQAYDGLPTFQAPHPPPAPVAVEFDPAAFFNTTK